MRGGEAESLSASARQSNRIRRSPSRYSHIAEPIRGRVGTAGKAIQHKNIGVALGMRFLCGGFWQDHSLLKLYPWTVPRADFAASLRP